MNRKLFSIFIFVISCVMFPSCEDNISIEIEDSLKTNTIDNVRSNSPLQILNNYIEQKKGITRSSENFNLIPYDFNGTVVMYIANYPDGGFDVFSAIPQAPMVLFSSDEGALNLNDTSDMPDALVDLFNSTAENLLEVSASGGSFDGSWNINDSQYPLIEIDGPIDFNYRVSPSNLGKGHWLEDTIKIQRNILNVPHLVTDHWSQLYPYNKYIKYINYPDGSWNHGYVGCCTIALGEYLHHLYKKTGHAPTLYSSADYDETANQYIFSNPTNTIWSELDNDIDSIATVLGYISQCISTRTDSTGTASNGTHMVNFLVNNCQLEASSALYDTLYIRNEIRNHYPVITVANGSSCHCFLIDGCREIEQYIAIRRRWVGTDASGQPTNRFNSQGDPISYRFIEYVYLGGTRETSFQMNWGWGISDYDRLWLNASSDWVLRDGLYFNSKPYIIKVEH